MCGILGICLSDGHSLKDKRAEIKALVRQLFVETQIRGRVSTGIAAITNKRVVFMKGKISGISFVHSEEFENFMNRVLLLDNDKDEYLYSIIGHCRLDTKGTPDDNNNNHPIVTDNMVGVHNGVISNDEELYETFKSTGIKRNGKVDSEVIFQLIDSMYKRELNKLNEGKKTLLAVKRAFKSLEGSLTCALLNKSEPHRIYLFRNHMDALNVMFYGDYGMTVFCSSKHFIDTSIEKAFNKKPENMHVEKLHTAPHSVLTIDLKHKVAKNEIAY